MSVISAFDLTDEERVFLAGHSYFDIAEFNASLEWGRHRTNPSSTTTPTSRHSCRTERSSTKCQECSAGSPLDPRRAANTTIPESRRYWPRRDLTNPLQNNSRRSPPRPLLIGTSVFVQARDISLW